MNLTKDGEVGIYKKRIINSISKASNYQSEALKVVNHCSKQTPKQKNNQRKPLRLPSVLPKHSLANIRDISNQINPSKINHPDYYLAQIIGQGAFAKVRKAIRKSDSKECAIKMYDKYRINTEARKKALKNEVEILSKIKHKFIISLIDFYETSQSYNLVMEYFSSCSLAAYAKEKRPLQNQEIKYITKSIAEALVYLHEKGIAHRDIKPQNILILGKNTKNEKQKLPNRKKSNSYIQNQGLAGNNLSEDLSLKIIDFGLSMTGQENEVKIVGTPQYMAPQLLKHYSSGNNYSSEQPSYDPYKADTWALGILLYWVALGYFPPSLNGKHSNKNKIELLFPVDIHPGFEYLLTKMLREDPSERIRINQVLQDSWLKPIDFKAEIMRLSNRRPNMKQKTKQQKLTQKDKSIHRQPQQ